MIMQKMKGPTIGVDMGGTNIRVGSVYNKKILLYREEAIRNKKSKKELLNQLTGLDDEVYSKKINGIGIGVPTIVDVKSGTAYEAFNIPAWNLVPLKRIL